MATKEEIAMKSALLVSVLVAFVLSSMQASACLRLDPTTGLSETADIPLTLPNGWRIFVQNGGKMEVGGYTIIVGDYMITVVSSDGVTYQADIYQSKDPKECRPFAGRLKSNH